MGSYGTDKAKEAAERHAENAQGKFVKFVDDGDKGIFAFLGEVYTKEVVWLGAEGSRKPEEYDEKKHGPEKTAKPRMQVVWNVYDFEQEKVRVLEQGVTFFRTWLQADEKYGKKWAFEIKRNGAKGNKKTTYSVFPERELKPDEVEMLSKLDLYELDNPEHSLGDDGVVGTAGNGVIEADTANSLITDLKELRDDGKPEVLTAFLKEFGIEAIRDVPKALADKALAFVAQHKPAAAAESKSGGETAERDPFA